MIGLRPALWAEFLKVRRSKMLWLTALALSLGPLAGALFMFVLQDPDRARNAGLVNAKAAVLAGNADWPTYASMLEQAVAIGGLVVFGIVVTWIFGREHSDHTAKDLLALPVGRETLVLAKYIVAAAWSLSLGVLAALLALTLGTALGLERGSAALARDAAMAIAGVTGSTILLVLPFGWVASAGRGYLPAIGAIFLCIFLAQVIAALGWGAFFPWSVPALAAGMAGPDAARLGIGSGLLVVIVGTIGVVLTLIHWHSADQA